MHIAILYSNLTFLFYCPTFSSLLVLAVIMLIFSNLFCWLYLQTEENAARQIQTEVRDYGRRERPFNAAQDMESKELHVSLSADGTNVVCGRISSQRSKFRSSFTSLRSSSKSIRHSSRLQDNAETTQEGGRDEEKGKEESTETEALSDECTQTFNSFRQLQNIEEAPEESITETEQLPHESGSRPESEVIDAEAGTWQSDQDRIWSVLQSLAEVEPLLRRHPDMLQCEHSDLGGTPLHFLRGQLEVMTTIAEQNKVTRTTEVPTISDADTETN